MNSEFCLVWEVFDGWGLCGGKVMIVVGELAESEDISRRLEW
jgi:hypothetical protein